MKQHPLSPSCAEEQITILFLWHLLFLWQKLMVYLVLNRNYCYSTVCNLSEQRKDSVPGEQKDEEIKLLP